MALEIAAAVGGALLSVSFEKLLDKLASPELRQFSSKKEVQSQLHEWEDMLRKIRGVLEDAENKQSRTEMVRIWLNELRHLVYDVEDALDEFATEVLRLEMKQRHQATRVSDKVRKLVPFISSTSAASSSSKSVKLNYPEMGSKLKTITARLNKICNQKSQLDLAEKAVGGGGRSDNSTASDQRLPTTSLPDPHIFGRGEDKQAILDLVLSGEQGDGSASAGGGSVIAIQGMGGLGKTTLAQLVYNDEKVKLHFDLRAWVCVSDPFDVPSITRTVIKSFGGGASNDMTLDQLQVMLESTVSKKKFLIVLDDVWNEDYDKWSVLNKPFQGGALGSKIIVTTRIQGVVSTMSAAQSSYGLTELSDEDCLSLFVQHALGAANLNGHPNLKEVGKNIVKKCQGLPLAAKTLGGLLRGKVHYKDWVDILESPIWNLPEGKSGILPALRLSYHHLPSQLKQCFAYCAIFPKDYEFDMNELVLLWMAEGFLSHPKRKKPLEDVGVTYFNDLLSRSFFQQSSKDRARFVMHDLIHDLAQDVAGEMCLYLDGSVDRAEHPSGLMTRHSSFNRSMFEISRRFGVFDEAKGLRTLLSLPVLASFDYSFVSVEVMNMVLSKLRKLRALSLSYYQIRKVPESLNGQKHLRYLNLSETKITLLPEFVTSLFNLQTLLLRECKYLEKLPASMGNLTNLRHLDICGTEKLKELPVGIGNLTELRCLAKFIVTG